MKIRSGETRELYVFCYSSSAPADVEIVAPFTDLSASYAGQRSGSAVYTVTAPTDFTGIDKITVRGINSEGVGPPTEQLITVREATANEAPFCMRWSGTIQAPFNTAALGNTSCKDLDLDHYDLLVVEQPAHGAAEIVPNLVWLVDDQPWGFRYTPAAGYVGADSFKVQARDALGATSPVYTVAVNVAAPPPVDVPGVEPPFLPAIKHTVSLDKLPRLDRALRRGLTVRVRSSAVARAQVRLTVGAKTARRLGLSRKSRTTTIARGDRLLKSGVLSRVKVTFTKTARRKLRKVKRVRVTVSVTTSSTTTKRVVTLRR